MCSRRVLVLKMGSGGDATGCVLRKRSARKRSLVTEGRSPAGASGKAVWGVSRDGLRPRELAGMGNVAGRWEAAGGVSRGVSRDGGDSLEVTALSAGNLLGTTLA